MPREPNWSNSVRPRDMHMRPRVKAADGQYVLMGQFIGRMLLFLGLVSISANASRQYLGIIRFSAATATQDTCNMSCSSLTTSLKLFHRTVKNLPLWKCCYYYLGCDFVDGQGR